MRPENIKFTGDSVSEITPLSFRVPSTLPGRLIPGGLVKLIHPLLWIQPSVSDECSLCGRCVEACPTEALVMQAEKSVKKKPVLDPKKCIGCCCCHEICPENAISIKQSPLLNLVRGGKIP